MRMNELLFENFEEKTLGDNIIEQLKNHLQQHCQEIYRNFYKNSNIFLYHSPDYDSVVELKNSIYKIFKNKNRDLNTEEIPHYYHEKMDNYFEQKFGLRFRTQSLFTMPRSALEKVHSNPIIFPHDGFQMLSSINVKDPFFNIKQCYDSEFVKNTIGKLLKEYIDDITDDSIDFISSLTFNMLKRSSFFHSKNFPENIDNFIEELSGNIDRITGIDLYQYDIPKLEFQKTLESIVNHCDEYIEQLLSKYDLIKNKSQLKKHAISKNKENSSEIMLYADHYTMVRFDLLYNYVAEKLEKKKSKPTDVINYLYSY